MLLNVAAVLVCLAMMAQLSTRWYALSVRLQDDAQANRLRNQVNWKKSPDTRRVR